MSAYTAPGRDGTYKSEPGRDKPAYPEHENLILAYGDDGVDDEDVDENPYQRRRPDPEDLDSDSDDDDDDDDILFFEDDEPPPKKQQQHDDDDDDDDDDYADDDDQETWKDEDPQGETSKKKRRNKDDDDGDDEDAPLTRDGQHYDDDDDNSQYVEEDEDQQREWKYSTAGLSQRGIWVKYCCIALMFAVAMGISFLISSLISKLFSRDSDPAPPMEMAERDENSTFRHDKPLIDQVCGPGAWDADGGIACQAACQPQFRECCDAFDPATTLDFTELYNATNQTFAPSLAPTLSLDDLFEDLSDCEFTDEIRGCTSYAKCSSLTGLLDPAPTSLEVVCDPEYIADDPQPCVSGCRNVQCCFNEEGLSCLTTNFDICLDYSACQNLRQYYLFLDNANNENFRTDRIFIPPAPSDLDRMCFWELPDCYDHCAAAECCADPTSRCFQENFITCLSYAPCSEWEGTPTNITVPPKFSAVPMVPADIVYSCSERRPETEAIAEAVEGRFCPEYCEQAACCYQNNAEGNCYRLDPLGCEAWHEHCQTLPVARSAWYKGTYD